MSESTKMRSSLVASEASLRGLGLVAKRIRPLRDEIVFAMRITQRVQLPRFVNEIYGATPAVSREGIARSALIDSKDRAKKGTLSFLLRSFFLSRLTCLSFNIPLDGNTNARETPEEQVMDETRTHALLCGFAVIDWRVARSCASLRHKRGKVMLIEGERFGNDRGEK